MNSPKHEQILRVVAWETTRRCELQCLHCRGSARNQDYPGELSTEEGFRLIDGIAAFSKPILILTGGEPMTRPDIYDLASHATSCGLRVVMAPCGPLINANTVQLIKQSGIQRISISLDGATTETHDAFRGVKGAFESAIRGIKHAKEAGIEFQINTTVTRHNVAELPDILQLAIELGAFALDIFFLVPTGRGTALKQMEISPEQYERALQWIAETSKHVPIKVKTTCAPHFARIQTSLSGRRGHASGCMGGRGFVFVSHRGIIQPCGFLDLACGDLRKENFNFRKIYEESEIFRKLRNIDNYGGKCGYCEYRYVCGGCRARGYVQSGDYLAEEPSCTYVPKAGLKD
ncbi:MAG: radical SAM protein [Kiritimatiellae bacterium]|nr:radical SAM protein [Kiritimatiellia bacterium]MDD5521999.1 radical SAM protein [Kiritimatiellia bacterium]